MMERRAYRALERTKNTSTPKETEYYLSTLRDGVWTHRVQSSDSADLNAVGREWVRLKTADDYQLTTFRTGI